ncbi:putative Lon protease [Yersinia ruckeri]|uniref:endopeptidase La n=2 Tax=Gammaproteobacteria TaxID=1236 RepID=A0A380QLC3_YERRU|nr:Lon protease [Yersinia ruckeri]QTD76279.1 ATP-dependent protease LonB [Yersinia ruckeri]CNH36957.1 putative Lon protease [Yersinia ruckeri]SUP97127.1 putative Lon protease [Yersinia ruckeri]SUP99471.1 putative Lon protease [Yersinia ruckeri]
MTIASNTLTNNRLEWQSLLPNTTPYEALFATAAQLAPVPFAAYQPRLENGLTLFCHPQSKPRFMLIKAQESGEYLALLDRAVKELQAEETPALTGGDYLVHGHHVRWQAAQHGDEPFAAKVTCLYQEWVEPEQLFGCVRIHKETVSLQPGLVHQANGGVLILSVRSLLAQPLMWLRLKQMITQQRFDWLSPDETRPLPLHIPSMPLDLRLVLVGDRLGLGDFHDMEPELGELAIYGEFEAELPLLDEEGMALWCGYINGLVQQNNLPPLSTDAWPVLLKQAIRYSGDQGSLPLCPQWLARQLAEAAMYTQQNEITADSLEAALNNRDWRHNYLAERMQDEIELGQIMIETEGAVVGQINGLSVLEYPGHPRAFGEPARISCVAHIGDGEFVDVERKAELGGNLHAKGMMIMQAFLNAELELDQPMPLSASIVFEQSYGEVDGDSASLAELCALISALSQQPINQQIAVTGSVDQFGHVQPIGGVNEKIEGFFEVCQRRGLTGTQGVILPSTNVRHLCLHPSVIDAVQNGQFHLWAVDSVIEALPLLTGLPYADEQQPSLLGIIQERIAQMNPQDRRRPWPLRWLNWFNQG